MAENSKIEWTDHTFNPWWGCAKVSPGCTHCYAEAFATRVGQKVWGGDSPRRLFGDKHWNEPRKWDRAAAKGGVRRRVFCASMADVFEDRRDLDAERGFLWELIAETPALDWLLLTKRPENAARLVPSSWSKGWPGNVWAGTTAEDQDRADQRIPHLLELPAAVRFLSVEPLLGPVDLRFPSLLAQQGLPWPACAVLDWIIVGGESGPGARLCDVDWIRSIVAQCKAAGVPVFTKQWGSRATVDGAAVALADRKGGDPAEWGNGDWPREFPHGA